MSSRIVIGCVVAGAFALLLGVSTSAQEAGGDEPVNELAPNPSAAGATGHDETDPPQARETFKSLVIAGLPPVLARHHDTLAARMNERGGVNLSPLWWRMDMAAFTSAEAFKGGELAKTLGLAVISDVSEDLILAPAETPQAIKAEARLFLMNLFRSRDNWAVWRGGMNGVTDEAQYGRASMGVGGFGIKRVIRFGPGGAVPARVRDGEDDTAEPDPLFSFEGPLDDVRVRNALGLRVQDLERPMLHYRIGDFRVTANAGYGSDASQQYGTGECGPVNTLTIYAHSGRFEQQLPKDPGFQKSGFLDDLVEGAVEQVMWGGMRSFYSYSNESRSEEAPPPDSPFFVALRLDDFRPVREASSSPAAPARSKDLPPRAAGDRTKALADPARLERERTHLPRRMIWIDANALDLIRDPADKDGPVRAAKREIVQRAARTFKTYAERQGANANFRKGDLGDYELKQHYGMDWGYFNISPYYDDVLEIAEGEKQAPGVVILRTKDKTHVPAFSVRIDALSGSVEWIKGEPESEDLISSRREEVLRGVELLYGALKQASGEAGFAPAAVTAQWADGKLKAAGFNPRYVARAEFKVQTLAPGFMRVSGETSSGNVRQSAVCDLATGRVYWETPRRAPKIELKHHNPWDED